MNVAEHVESASRAEPSRPAILFEGCTLSYQELNRRAGRVAQLLERRGVRVGDRVALFLPNIPEFAITYLGALKVGAVPTSINTMLTTPEASYLLRDSGAVMLITTEALLVVSAPVLPTLPALREVILCEGAPGDTRALGSATDGLDGVYRSVSRSTEDPAAVLYTSGTTGTPKGAVLTHGNLVSNYLTTAKCVGAGPGDRHLLYLPLYHCFGQNFIMNAAFSSRGTVVLERRYQHESTLADVARYRVTHFYGVPTIYIYLLRAGVERRALSSVRYFFSAAATMPRDVAQSWREKFGIPIHEGYGLTETAPLASYNHGAAYRLGSIGTPVDGVEMKIIDEQGRERPPCEHGEICIKGPNVMVGYLGRDEETCDRRSA